MGKNESDEVSEQEWEGNMIWKKHSDNGNQIE